MQAALDQIGQIVGGYLPHLIGALVILILGWLVARVVAEQFPVVMLVDIRNQRALGHPEVFANLRKLDAHVAIREPAVVDLEPPQRPLARPAELADIDAAEAYERGREDDLAARCDRLVVEPVDVTPGLAAVRAAVARMEGRS